MQAKTAGLVEALDLLWLPRFFVADFSRQRSCWRATDLLMIFKNEGALSVDERADDLVYPRELHAIGADALVATRPDAAQLPPERRFQSLRELADRVEREPVLPLRALVFHCSRCGSTLLARLFVAEGSSRVFAEPEVLGKFFWSYAGQLARGEMRRELAAFVRAFGLEPKPGERGLVIKLPSWALRFIGPLRACFPGTPFAYLLRDPVEVVASISGYRPGFLRDENRDTIATAFGGDPEAVRHLQPAEWHAWYVDRNLRLALQHASEFNAVIDHARFAEESVRWVNAMTSARLAPDRSDVGRLLSRHAKSPAQTYQPDAVGSDADLAKLVTPLAGEAYRLWQRRLEGSL